MNEAKSGGQRGIRTPDTLAGTPDFEPGRGVRNEYALSDDSLRLAEVATHASGDDGELTRFSEVVTAQTRHSRAEPIVSAFLVHAAYAAARARRRQRGFAAASVCWLLVVACIAGACTWRLLDVIWENDRLRARVADLTDALVLKDLEIDGCARDRAIDQAVSRRFESLVRTCVDECSAQRACSCWIVDEGGAR